MTDLLDGSLVDWDFIDMAQRPHRFGQLATGAITWGVQTAGEIAGGESE